MVAWQHWHQKHAHHFTSTYAWCSASKLVPVSTSWNKHIHIYLWCSWLQYNQGYRHTRTCWYHSHRWSCQHRRLSSTRWYQSHSPYQWTQAHSCSYSQRRGPTEQSQIIAINTALIIDNCLHTTKTGLGSQHTQEILLNYCHEQSFCQTTLYHCANASREGSKAQTTNCVLHSPTLDVYQIRTNWCLLTLWNEVISHLPIAKHGWLTSANNTENLYDRCHELGFTECIWSTVCCSCCHSTFIGPPCVHHNTSCE